MPTRCSISTARVRRLLFGEAAHSSADRRRSPKRRAVRGQSIVLEHDTEAARFRQLRADILPVDQHAAGRRLDETGQQFEHGGFAGAGCAGLWLFFSMAIIEHVKESGQIGTQPLMMLIPGIERKVENLLQHGSLREKPA